MKFEPVISGRHDIVGEAPHWDAATQSLYWVDINAGLASCLDARSGKVTDWRLGESIGAVVPAADGSLAVALQSGLYRFDPTTGTRKLLAALEPNLPGNRSNETRVDPAGRLWIGTMQNDVGPQGEDVPVTEASGSLYCIETNGSFRRIDGPFRCPNTLCWDLERRRLYFGDSLAQAIWVYDWDPKTGAATNRRVFADTPGHGMPDGSGIDAEGYLWNARWGGECLIRYAPDGRIDRIIEVPVKQPTSCVFGGPDLRTLYLTSAAIGQATGTGSLEGTLLRAEAPVRGQACTRFGG